MLIDLIPHYYDDSRVIRLLGEDGEVEKFEEINKQLPDGRTWNDVTRGKYDVVVNTGPAYATRRQEAADNLMKLSDNPVIGQVGMDILVRALDMPLGDKLADRLKRMLPPGLDDDADKEAKERKEQGQGPPEQPSPEQMKMQAEQQMAQAKMELDAQATQQKLQIQSQETQAKLAMAQAEAEAELELAERKQYAEMELARERFEFEMKLALQKAGLDARIAEHNAELKERGAEHAAHLAERKADQPQPKKAAK
jgi:hypothetical protein